VQAAAAARVQKRVQKGKYYNIHKAAEHGNVAAVLDFLITDARCVDKHTNDYFGPTRYRPYHRIVDEIALLLLWCGVPLIFAPDFLVPLAQMRPPYTTPPQAATLTSSSCCCRITPTSKGDSAYGFREMGIAPAISLLMKLHCRNPAVLCL
jgi:hypothetical protein